jgi:hypothetical protein
MVGNLHTQKMGEGRRTGACEKRCHSCRERERRTNALHRMLQ